MAIRVVWEGLGRGTVTHPGVKLSFLLMQEGIDFPLPCGGEGICGRCRVRFLEHPPPPSETERRILSPKELREGVRLACCAVVTQDTRVELLDSSCPLPREALSPLSELLPPDLPPREGEAALALDLGTTTLVLSRLGIKERRREKATALLNPQLSWGGDLISRIRAAIEGSSEAMAKAIWRLLSAQIRGVSYAVISGNSVMEAILAGFPLDSLARYPFVAPFKGGVWRDEPIPCYYMPVVGHFLGGDTASLLLVLDLIGVPETGVAMDLGTNAEVVAWSPKGVWATSAPAGPAFEGMGISSGVGLSSGGVAQVKKEGDTLLFRTLNGVHPRGFCGSGLISLLALLLREEVVEPSGRIKGKDELSRFWRERRDERGLCLEGLTLTQEDVRKIQLAKGAITSALRVLLPLAGIKGKFPLYLAGAFGSSLSVDDLVGIGVVPRCVSAVVSLGDTSLMGAEAVALSTRCLHKVEELASKVKVVDLVNRDDYQDIYLGGLTFESWELE